MNCACIPTANNTVAKMTPNRQIGVDFLHKYNIQALALAFVFFLTTILTSNA